MNPQNSSRRSFFKQALGAVGAIVAAPALIKSLLPSVAKAADVKYVVPGQGMAASVNYLDDKSKAKKELQTDRSGTKFKDQTCANCQLYTKDKGGDYGACALFPGQMVKAKSWCASWSKKA